MLRDDKEQVAKMKRFRLIGVALLAVFALSAVVATVAQAEEAPFWTVGGSRLKAGQTRNITAKAFSANLKLSTPEAGITVTCNKVKLNVGVILGSEKEEPGKNDEVAEFSECTQSGNGEKCTLLTSIITTPLTSELVENVESKKVGKKLLVEFFPTSGTNFATLVFSGECKIKETKVTGKVAAEVLTDPGEAAIELGQAASQAKSYLLKFPATSVTEVWLIKAGVGSAVKVGLTAFGDESFEAGTTLVLLEGEGEWSPLP